MLKEKQEQLLRYRVTADYLMSVIDGGQKGRRKELNESQFIIVELENQIDFLKR